MTDKEKKELELSQKKEIDASSGEPTREGVVFVPEVDIVENDTAITLYADLPGAESKNLDIDVREGVLTLSATVKAAEGNWRQVYKEYEVGGYQRRFNLGEKIDTGKIAAKFQNGVLELTLPKMAEHQPRKIKVSS
jgi:HSP20 family molecular chaperone IbpA